MEKHVLNEHNKEEYPPMHTTEHILNATMVKMFGCSRSFNAHIERKKSKCDYLLGYCPTDQQVQQIESNVNQVINRHLDVITKYVTYKEAIQIERLDLSKLPNNVSDILRIVFIGDYDICACIGLHVNNTSEIRGTFKIISYDWIEGTLRLRFKLLD